MAIYVRCLKCQATHAVGTKRCEKCGDNLAKNRNYKVVIKLPTGRWKTKTVDTLELARSFEAKYRDDLLRKGELGIIRAPLIEEVWESLYAQCRQTLKHPEFYECRWRCHIEPFFGGYRMDAITPAALIKFMDHLASKRVSKTRLNPNSEKKTLAISLQVGCVKQVGRMFNHAREVGLYRGDNPVKNVKLTKFNNQVENPLTDDELIRLVDTLNTWPNRMVALALKLCMITGKRTGEVFGLTWEDIDIERGRICFTVKSQRQNDRQYLPMGQRAREIFEQAKESRLADSPLVFHTNKGKQIHYRAIWLRIKKKAGLRKEIRPHDLRHTFATRLASSGEVDIYTIQKLLGHKTISMTQRYAHLMDETLRTGLEVAENVFSAK